MTFNPDAPSNSQSPGVFPAQNRTNMGRIKDLFNNDHFFNDTKYAGPNLPGTDGAHRQMTMVDRATVTVLPNGTNAVLYTKVDSLSRSQLFFFNGLTTEQITPRDDFVPYYVAGIITVPANTAVTIYPDPGFFYAGTGYSIQNSTPVLFNYYNIIRKSTNQVVQIKNVGSTIPPILRFSGNDIEIKNNTGTPMSCDYSLILNRIP